MCKSKSIQSAGAGGFDGLMELAEVIPEEGKLLQNEVSKSDNAVHAAHTTS